MKDNGPKKRFDLSFSKYIARHQAMTEMYSSGLDKPDHFFDVSNHLLDIQGDMILLNKLLLEQATESFPDNPWTWYFRSVFLHRYTELKSEAYNYAIMAVDVLEKENSFAGAISINHISLSVLNDDLDAAIKEIQRNASKGRQDNNILAGIANELIRLRNQGVPIAEYVMTEIPAEYFR